MPSKTSDTSESKPSQVVLAPLVLLKDQAGRASYVYRGQPVDGFDSADVARLKDMGMVGDADGDEDLVPGVAARPI